MTAQQKGPYAKNVTKIEVFIQEKAVLVGFDGRYYRLPVDKSDELVTHLIGASKAAREFVCGCAHCVAKRSAH